MNFQVKRIISTHTYFACRKRTLCLKYIITLVPSIECSYDLTPHSHQLWGRFNKANTAPLFWMLWYLDANFSEVHGTETSTISSTIPEANAVV
jgi:hypothetical protein